MFSYHLIRKKKFKQKYLQLGWVFRNRVEGLARA